MTLTTKQLDVVIATLHAQIADWQLERDNISKQQAELFRRSDLLTHKIAEALSTIDRLIGETYEQ